MCLLCSMGKHRFFVLMATATRGGGPDKLQLEEALYDDTAGLTYPAFTGQRKQSVRDAECLFSTSMAAFMKTKGYKFEMEYITAACF